MNTRLKTILLNGLTHGGFFFLLGFLIGYYLFNFPVPKSLLGSAPVGLAGFIIYGFIQSRFTKPLKTLHAITILPDDFEQIKMEAPANHMIEDHLISGKLVLTQKRLIFKSYEQVEHSWLLTQLHSFKFYTSLFNAGGEFILKDENEYQLVFEVDEVRLWKRSLLAN